MWGTGMVPSIIGWQVNMHTNYLERYFISGSQDLPEHTLDQYISQVKQIMAAGITAYQFREKAGGVSQASTRLLLAQTLKKLAHQYQIPFFVDDDVALALAVGADGIHVGQADMPITDVFASVPAEMLIGLSVRTVSEMQAAQMYPRVDYLGVGPIYPTVTKKDAAAAQGITGLQEMLAANKQHFPVVAIGGITLAHLPELKATGVQGVAFISMALQTRHPDILMQEMEQIWHDNNA